MIRVQTTTHSVRVLARESLRKIFSNDLKLHAMNLIQSGLTITEVSAQIGVEKRNIIHWAQLYAENNGESFSPSYYKATGEAKLRLRINTPNEELRTETEELRAKIDAMSAINLELRTKYDELRTKNEELGTTNVALTGENVELYLKVKEQGIEIEAQIADNKEWVKWYRELSTENQELSTKNLAWSTEYEALRTKYTTILNDHIRAK